MQLKLTHTAFKALYGGGRVVLTDDALYPTLEPMADGAFTLLVSDGAGAIHAPLEAAGDADLPLMGVPLGLVAFILSEDHSPVVREWGAELLLAKSNRPFDILLVPAEGDAMADRVGPFFQKLQNRLLQDLTAQAGSLERQTLYLRQASERLMLELTAARRVIEGIGFSDLTVVAEAPLGKGTAGPGAMMDVSHFTQLLPADGLGLSALGLYVVPPRGTPAEGVIRIAVRRDADGKLLGEEIRPYSALEPGWSLIRFPEAVSNIFGDVRLEVSWHRDDGPAAGDVPHLGLSDILGNRFGDDETGRSLAVRVFKSVGQPTLPADGLALVPQAPGLPLVLLPGHHAAACDFYGGQARFDAVTADVGFTPYRHSGAEGWLEAHLASDRITGMAYKGTIPDGTVRIELTVSVPAPAGPEVAFHAFLADSLDSIEARVSKVLAGDEAEAHGFDHTVVLVAAGGEGQLTLVPEHVRGRDRVLLIVAKALTGRISEGWCRWSKAIFRVAAGKTEGRVLPALVPEAATAAPKKVVRTIKLPELGGMAQFISGAERLSELSAELGFCPMIMDENGGYLQTHPLRGMPSGAVLPSLIAPGTQRIVASAHTGHADAPDFLYAALLVRHDITDVEGVAKSVMDGLSLESGQSVQGADKRSGLYWQALRLPPGQEGQLELSFQEPLDAVYHLALMTRPVDDLISFGWCRWTTLGIMSFERSPKA